MGNADKVVSVVIPIYKTTLTELERISLSQGLKIFTDVDIIFIKPKFLKRFDYSKTVDKHKCVVFSDEFFSSIAGYNKLLVSPSFYRQFLVYKYILIYQLDGFVFSNALKSWCALNLDYLGAPWIEHPGVDKFRNSLRFSNNKIVRVVKKIDFGKRNQNYVGNGGVSLRRVRKFYALSLFVKPLLSVLKHEEWNEDFVWCLFVAKYFPFFKIADFSTALRFAVETKPSVALAHLHPQLPFCIHGWYTSNEILAFWKPFIEKFGYVIERRV
jgi:hypothetical protein